MWPKATLAADAAVLRQRNRCRTGRACSRCTLRRRSLGELDHASLAARIDAFAREHALLPVLISIGPSLFNSGLLRDVAARMTGPHVLLDDPLGLREIAAAIAHAALYVGASFHGYVTAAVYDVPGVMVARPAFRKFGGFCGRPGGCKTSHATGCRLLTPPPQALAQPRADPHPASGLGRSRRPLAGDPARDRRSGPPRGSTPALPSLMSALGGREGRSRLAR